MSSNLCRAAAVCRCRLLSFCVENENDNGEQQQHQQNYWREREYENVTYSLTVSEKVSVITMHTYSKTRVYSRCCSLRATPHVLHTQILLYVLSTCKYKVQ